MGKLLAWLLVAGKLGKLLTTGGTMLLSIVVFFAGPPVAGTRWSKM